jgi:hypothetical protein
LHQINPFNNLDSHRYVQLKNKLKIKKTAFILVTVFFNTALFSCTPDSIIDKSTEQVCCDGEEQISPPPTGD